MTGRSFSSSVTRLIAVAAVLLGGAAVGAGATSAAASAPRVAIPQLDWRSCGPNGLQCARARVPLDYDNPGGPQISIALDRLPATDPAHRIGSVFINPGGPGGSGVDAVAYGGTEVFGPQVRARFDIVGFDPRGVARSSPVQCFADQQAEDDFFATVPFFPVGSDEVVRYMSKFQRYDSLCLRNDPTIIQHMATADVARDLDLLRAAVGDRRLTYYGVSYGSYLGNTYANLFPDRVRALAIDGVLNPTEWATGRGSEGSEVPFSARLGSERGAAATMRQFLALCDRAQRPACTFAGDAATKYAQLLARAQDAPILLGRQRITYADIAGFSLGALYDPYYWAEAAQLLQRLWRASGGATVTASTAAAPWLRDPPYYNGQDAFSAVSCTDSDNPGDVFAWPRAAADLDRTSAPFGAAWTYASAPCASWPTRDTDRYTGPWNHTTATPVLVVGNRYDPATPYAGAVAVARQLPGARLLTLAGWGHTSLFKSACTAAAIDRYLLSKRLPPAGKVCQPDTVPFQSTGGADSLARSALLVSTLPPTLAAALRRLSG